MTEAEDQFFPDDVDEQVEQCVESQPSSMPDNQLIRDLYAFYEEDARILHHVWERLSNRLPERGIERFQSSRLPPNNM